MKRSLSDHTLSLPGQRIMKSCKLDPPPITPSLAQMDEKLLDGSETRPVGILAEYPKPLRIVCRKRVARQREGNFPRPC
jgi:hypothetical protein